MRPPVLLLIWMLCGCIDGFSIQNCRVSVETDEYNAVDSNGDFTITCNYDQPVDACTVSHYSPLRDSISSKDTPDHKCVFANTRLRTAGGASGLCDQRIDGQASGSSCTVTVQSSEPEDSGDWKMIAISTDNSDQPKSQTRTFEVFTHNASYVELRDEDRNRVNNHATKYNRDDREEDWLEGEGGFETVEFICFAAGGRPRPSFTWYIGRNNNDKLVKDDVFDISDEYGQVVRTYGNNGIITDSESTIRFQVDDKLLERLRMLNIDTNPEQGDFSFDLTCEVEQSGSNSKQLGAIASRETLRINVEKVYDNGELKASTIGIIVGVTVAVVLLGAAIALLLFAKSRGQWCFADDYKNPEDPRSRPQQGGIPQNPPPPQGRQNRRQ